MLHRTLKHYFEPNTGFHEIPFLGSVADIKNDDGIIEIQTRSFEKLVPKLEKFLPETRVTVVYPIVERKTICRINVESGESLPPKKSTKKGRYIDALPELAKIGRFLFNDNLKVLLVFLNASETRMVGATKRVGRRKTAKLDIIPTSINSIFEINETKDFLRLLPAELPDEFTSEQFERITHLHAIDLHNTLMLLLHLGILTRDKRGGRSYIYLVNKNIR